VTGEGRLDSESFNGKVVGGVLDLARAHSLPALVVSGAVDGSATGLVTGRVTTVSTLERFGSDASWGDPLNCVTATVAEWLEQGWTST